eukprot:8055159-Prorocentrum_lima.AAC.1
MPIDALRDLIVKPSSGKESPVAFQQMPFQHALHFDELNVGRIKSNRPAINYDQLQPTFTGTF